MLEVVKSVNYEIRKYRILLAINLSKSHSGIHKTTLKVLPPENLPFDLAIDPTRRGIFWSEPYSGRVMYAGLDGSGVTNISTGLDFPSGKLLVLGCNVYAVLFFLLFLSIAIFRFVLKIRIVKLDESIQWRPSFKVD